ncbi:MAG: hypothetical protein P8N23_00030 [Methylophilaceae bacterium]|nr:hypothetical protein [Methylophilaceae bacterium]
MLLSTLGKSEGPEEFVWDLDFNSFCALVPKLVSAGAISIFLQPGILTFD